MREDPMRSTTDTLGDDNVVALPNLMGGRLADLLAAASGPAQDHELAGESDVRAAFRSASVTWPAPRRRLRRTPAVVAVTTVATMMVATTGLAAATELPGDAGRAVQGILGSVGVTDAPPAPGHDVPAVTASGPVVVPSPTGAGRYAVTRGGCANDATAGGGSASCTVALAPHTLAPATTTAPVTAPRTPVHHTPAPVVHGPAGGAHPGGTSGGGTTGGSGSGSLGGGTTRGGNQGGGTCDTGGGSTSTTTTTDPGTTSPTTTVPTATGPGCGTGKHHRHGGTGTAGTTGTTP